MTEKTNAVEVSVIIPTYNVEKFIGQCLDTLVKQTCKAFEVLCVDDGSTDQTKDIIRKFEKKDTRIRLIEKEHCGFAGVMRNIGIDASRGEFLLFLDSDDFFEPELIAHTLAQIRKDNADVCLFDARDYDNESGFYKTVDNILRNAMLPENIPFRGQDYPYLYNVTTTCPWSKLFRKKMIEEHKIRFMELRRSNDIYFVLLALTHAERITVLPEPLVNYRKHGNSLQDNNANTPFDWYYALKKLRETLIEEELFEKMEPGFKNMVVWISIYNLISLKNGHSFEELYQRLREEIYAELGLQTFAEEECLPYVRGRYDIYQKVLSLSPCEYLFEQIDELKKEKESLIKWNIPYRLSRKKEYLMRKRRKQNGAREIKNR